MHENRSFGLLVRNYRGSPEISSISEICTMMLKAGAPQVGVQSSARTQRGNVRAYAASPPPSAARTPSPGPGGVKINIIENNGRDDGRAINGIPPVMGAHLMASGAVAPMSVSKGPGLDVTPHPFQYPGSEGDASVILHFSKNGVATALVKAVKEAADAAIAAKGTFTLVLSGGSLLNLLSGLTDAKQKLTNLDKWHIFYVDERNVPHDSPDSNHKAAKDAFLSKLPIPAANIHAILENVPVEQAAINYEGRLVALPPTVLPRNAAGFPVFDLILLGMGPDGHVASLFPNKPQTAATSGWVLPVTNSPKPPPERITFTLPVINAAKDVILVAAGAEKAEVVQRALEVQSLPGALPAQLVRPTEGRLRWFLELISAQNLKIDEWQDAKQFPRST